MSGEPSTSKDSSTWEDSERSKLLQQALTQAGANRAQKQKKGMRLSTPTPHSDNQNIQKSYEMISSECETIKAHPVMPILQLLCEKCEEAIQTMKPSAFQLDDIVKLFASLESCGVTGSTTNLSLDQLMWDAILVLRTHLLELEKVASLVEDFHYRYLQALRNRVSHEVLIGTSTESDEELGDIGISDPEISRGCAEGRTIATITTATGTVSIPFNINPLSVTMINSDLKRSNTQSPSVKPSSSKIPRFDFTSIDRNSALQSSSNSRQPVSLLHWINQMPKNSLVTTSRFCDTLSSSNSLEE